MSNHPIAETLRDIERLWSRIKSELSRHGHWIPFCEELSAILATLDAPDGAVDWIQARERLDRVVDRYDVVLAEATVYRGGSGYESSRGDPVYRGQQPIASLLRSLRTRFEGEVVPSLVTYPEIRAPQEVLQQATFRVEVAARANPSSPDTKPAILPRKERGPVDLDVELRLPDGLVGSGAASAVLRVPEAGDSAVIQFEVTAHACGRHEIQVTVRRGTVEVAVLRTLVLVRSAAEDRELPTVATVAVSAASVQGPSAPPAGLVLHLRPSASTPHQHIFRAVLHGDSTLLSAPVSDLVPLTVDAPRLLGDLCRQMQELVPLVEARTREHRLKRIGMALGEQLLPATIRRALASRSLGEGTSLHIESDDVWVPWEVVAIEDDADGFFLGERFAVTRWLRQGIMRAEVAGGRATLVAPKSARFDLTFERAALQRISGSEPLRLESLSEVHDCMSAREPAHGFLHFACHGTADPEALLNGKLLLEDSPLVRVDVPRLREGAATGPLVGSSVFINACEGEIPGRQLTGHGGWAGAFLAAGAAVVVAPAWSVKIATAPLFAKRFYAALGEGLTAGASARQARLAGGVGNPDRLAYAVYAAPWARLSPPARP